MKKITPPGVRTISPILIGVGLILIGFVLFLQLLARLQTEKPQELSAIPVPVNYTAPSLKLLDIQAKPAGLEDYLGRVVLVNLWATWCPPCKAEMPVLQSFYAEHKSQGFVILGIDDGELTAIVKSFIVDYKLTFPIWLDPDFQTERSFSTINLPSSWVIDRQGKVVLSWVGAISAEKLKEYVVPLIKE